MDLEVKLYSRETTLALRFIREVIKATSLTIVITSAILVI